LRRVIVFFSFCRFWKTSLPLEGLDEGDGEKSKPSEEEEETITTTAVLGATAGQDDYGSYGMRTESQTAETEQLLAAEGEERKKFAIKSVVNPVDGSEISLQQAIMFGIMQPEEGVYYNSVTGEKKPIPTAMSEGLIKVSKCF